MHHVMNAETGYFHIEADNPEDRRLSCEQEIAAVLEKYDCVLIVQVAAKEPPK